MTRLLPRVLIPIHVAALVAACGGAESSAAGFEDWAQPVREKLEHGEIVVLPHRPDETAGERDAKFVTVAKLVAGSRTEIWKVIHDKEGAEDFVAGVLESKVVEEAGNRIVVDQRTRVGGPKGSYRYRLVHELLPMKRSDFRFVHGEIRDIEGSWWIFDAPGGGSGDGDREAGDRCLVVYSLYINPGIFAPQAVVKAGMKKSMPGTIRSMEAEVTRRRKVRKAQAE